MSKNGLQLPCFLEKLGCDTTSFDPYAYTWDAPDHCVLAIHLKKDVNMIKQGKNNYYIVSEQHQSVSVRSKNETRSLLQQTSTSIPYQLRFVIRGYRLGWIRYSLWKEDEFLRRNRREQYYQLSVSSDGRLFVHKPESPHTDNPNSETPHYFNLDYELHQGTKLDYLFFESSKMLEGSEIQLLKNLCEQVRTHI